MSEFLRDRGVATEIIVPIIDVDSPGLYKSGLTLTDEAYARDIDDSAGWEALALDDTFTEIGATGLYSIKPSAVEMEQDIIIIKIVDAASALGSAEDCVIIYTNLDIMKADVTGVGLSAAAIASIHDEVIEGTLTSRQAQRLFLAALVGLASGGGTTGIAYRDIADSKDRIVLTVDSNGNRSVVVLDGT
ncbi:hypothetical protein LCGC14_0775420 [marine sediment metagenome]|uniref:Uncharacterized protein n=1 Tax=marine sediment metagenome TaxID=412755 RepID=A0A0F9QGX2_9ZZZZ